MSVPEYGDLRKELKPGERLIWAGRPRRGVHLSIHPALLVVIAPIALAVVLVMTALTIALIRNPKFVGAVFLLIGWFLVYAVVLERFVDALRRRNTVYGVTNRRAIVITGLLRPRARSVDLRWLTTVEVIAHPSQIGTIRCIANADGWYRQNRRKEIKPVPLFRAIVDPLHVRDLLVEANGGVLPLRTGGWRPHS